MSGATIAQVVGLLLALILALRGLSARRMDTRRTALLAAAWVAIIVVLTIVVRALVDS